MISTESIRMGRDGLPKNITADPKCTLCNGHGVLEDSEASMFCFVPCDCCCVMEKAYGPPEGKDIKTYYKRNNI
jgi:hypothetical protein